jgi:hypothetical protein
VSQIASGMQDLRSIRLTLSSAPVDSFFTFQSISRAGSRPGGDPDAPIFTNDRSRWVSRNSGQIISSTVDRNSGVVATTNASAASIRTAGAAFLSRIETNDISVNNDELLTTDDMQGIRTGLRNLAATLASNISNRLGFGWHVHRDEVLFVPHDEGRKALPFILTFAVDDWGTKARIYVPVSFVINRNATNDGYVVTVNPRDATNRERVSVEVELDALFNGNKLLNETRNEVAALAAGFYETPRSRLERAISNARSPRAAPATFDVIVFTQRASDGTTNARNKLSLRILE